MFDEGPRPNMVIRTRGAVLGRTKVTSRAGDEDAEVAVDLQASHRSFCRSHSGTLNESTNVGVKTSGSRVGGLELIGDQVSTDICDVVQASKSDLMVRGVAVDLLHMAKRVGPLYEVAEHKKLVCGGRFLLGQCHYRRLKGPSNLFSMA